jgi:molybdopterin-containing oxidoreductase family iron-sulfur binding subunit
VKITRKEFLRGVLVAAAATLSGAGTRAATDAGTGGTDTGDPPAVPRWGMAIDVQKCRWDEGCSQCIQACVLAHNIPAVPDPAHDVKWIWKASYEAVFPQQSPWIKPDLASHPLVLMCNHCTNPACVRVCPTDATWKRDDGIVMMDWHRCIGCRYCMAACPYGSRSFNFSDPRPDVANINPAYPTREKGVVEKCTFCEERLARGAGPACVETCPQNALSFGDLNDRTSAIRSQLRTRYAMQRLPELGAGPAVYYLL